MLFALGGCSAAAVAALDNAMTSVNGDTCSVAKIFRGEAPCEDPDPEEQVVEEPLHCYRTLGVIDCYETKDPFARIEGRSPDDKLQVASPPVEGVLGRQDVLKGKRLKADLIPTIVRRSTPLELPEQKIPVKKKIKKEAVDETAKQPVQPETQPAPAQPFGPVKGKKPPLES